jgi:hypothetical protein
MSTAGSYAALPQNNVMTAFRQDPALFWETWSQPPLLGLSGKRLPGKAMTDLVLHGFDVEPSSWVDYLYPFAWEREYDAPVVSALCRKWWWLPYAAAILYLVGLVAGQAYMKDRKPFNLRITLSMWNLFLAVFSLAGTLRTMPHLFLMLREGGFEYTICRAGGRGYGSGATGVWVSLFIFSKYFELFDTVLLVARKRTVGFLHWYHHCTVLMYCWHAYIWEMPTGIYFIVMNYAVHALMYFYYFLAAVVAHPPKWGFLVTMMQLAQMAGGIFVTTSHARAMVYGKVPNCDGHFPNLVAALGMYASYFLLFAQFACKRYCRRSNGVNGVKKPAKKTE